MSDVAKTRRFTKFSPSFVDESLFGTRRTTKEAEKPCKDFEPPWIMGEERKINRSRPLLLYCPSLATNANFAAGTNKMEIIPSPKPKGRPFSARAYKLRMTFSPSYVDESLFKSPRKLNEMSVNFDPPWVDNADKKTKPILWDYFGSRPASSIQPGEGIRSSNVIRSASPIRGKNRNGESGRIRTKNKNP